MTYVSAENNKQVILPDGILGHFPAESSKVITAIAYGLGLLRSIISTIRKDKKRVSDQVTSTNFLTEYF